MTANATEEVITPDNTDVVGTEADAGLSEQNEDNVMGAGLDESVDSVNVDVDAGETLLGSDDAKETLAPEVYEDFTLPEGFEAGEEELNGFKASAKELNLTQEQAQKLLDKQIAVREEQKNTYEQEKYQQQQEWVDELKNDATFGGKFMSETVERANRTLRTFGDESISELLKTTGYGNNPAIIKMFAKIDKQLGEDKSVDGEPGIVDEKSVVDQMFNHPTSQ